MPDPTTPAVDVWEHVDLLAHTITTNCGTGRDEAALRLLEASAAAGEAARAYLGATGRGPEGATTHTSADVAVCLCDTAIAALLALRSFSDDPPATLDRYLRSRKLYLTALDQSWADKESA